MTGIGLFIVGLLAFTAIQVAAPGLIGNDSYYHARMAQLMLQHGPLVNFVWLPQTTLSPAEFYNHHLLYHVYLAAVTGLFPGQSLLAAKLSTVVSGALLIVAIWWLLKKHNVPYAILWTLLLFGLSQSFLVRLSMVRASVTALLILIVGFHLLLQRHYWWVVLLGFVFAWAYNGFPLLLLLGGTVAVSNTITEGHFDWRSIAAPTVGVVSGMLINPYFPSNIAFTLQHIGPKLTAPQSPLVGAEWSPITAADLFSLSYVAVALFFIGILLVLNKWRQVDAVTLAAALLAIGFGAMMLRSVRFVEYWPAFVLIFAALAARPYIRGLIAGNPWIDLALPALMLFSVIVSGGITINATRHVVAFDIIRFQEAANWLEANTPEDSLVYLANWGDFPEFFYFNTHNVYSAGLDPTFTLQHDPGLHDAYVGLTFGSISEIGDTVHDLYGANYIFVRETAGFLTFRQNAMSDPTLAVVYQDQFGTIYQYVALNAP